MKFALFCLLGILVSLANVFADPSPAKAYKHPKSKCMVQASAGEYPTFVTYRNKKVIYEPASDGIVDVQFSPSGRYIAFTSGEVSGIDVEKNKYDFSLVILNCETGKLKGYEKSECSKPSDPAVCIATYSNIEKWSHDEKILSYFYIDNKKKERKTIEFLNSSLP